MQWLHWAQLVIARRVVVDVVNGEDEGVQPLPRKAELHQVL